MRTTHHERVTPQNHKESWPGSFLVFLFKTPDEKELKRQRKQKKQTRRAVRRKIRAKRKMRPRA